MIKVSVLYPKGEGRTFDHDYYRDSHMPMVARLVGEPLQRYYLERGVAGGTPDAPPPFRAAPRPRTPAASRARCRSRPPR